MSKRQTGAHFYRPNRHIGMNLGYAGQPCNQASVQAFKIFQITAYNPQNIIRLARHQMALQNFRHILHRRFKFFKRLFTLRAKAHRNEKLHGKSQFVRTQSCTIGKDKPFFLQRLQPPVTGGGRQAHLFPQPLNTLLTIRLYCQQQFSVNLPQTRHFCKNS